jgi:uncharacterized protein (TIGR02996 family)
MAVTRQAAHRPPARPELVSLLRAAREQPQDDSVRLVLADWLEEFGDEADLARAELVRTQCRLEQDRPTPDGTVVVPPPVPGRAALLLRQDRLLARWKSAWLGPLARLAQTQPFRRGMVTLVAEAGELPRLTGPRQEDAEPWAWVEALELRGVPRRWLAQLANNRHLNGVTSLKVVGEVGRVEMRALARAPWFRGLRELDLAGSQVADDSLALLAGPAFPPGLERLVLSRAGFTRHGAECLFRSRGIRGLTALDLSHNRLGGAVVEPLLAEGRPGRLKELSLAGNGLGPSACEALARGPLAAGLRALDLSRNPIGPTGAAALSGPSGLGGLTCLDVSQCQLTTEGARSLLEAPHLQHLNQFGLGDNDIADITSLPECGHLCLLGNPLGENGIARLAQCQPLRRLRSLSLAGCGVTPGPLGALARVGWLSSLSALDLGNNLLGEDGVVALMRRGALGTLASLGLAGCGLEDRAVRRLAGADCLARLSCLHLEDNRVGTEGAKALAGLGGLIALCLDSNPVGDEGAAELVGPTAQQLAMLSLRDCDITDHGVRLLAGLPGLGRITRLALAGPDLGAEGAVALLESAFAGSLQLLRLQGAIHDPGVRQELKSRFGCGVECWHLPA